MASTLIMLDGGHTVEVGGADPEEVRRQQLERLDSPREDFLKVRGGSIIDPRKIVALVKC